MFLRKSQMKCENAEMLDLDHVYFGAIIFYLHGSGSISQYFTGKSYFVENYKNTEFITFSRKNELK